MPPAPPLEQAHDVATALANVQQNWQKLGVDRSNIVVMGHSAGAHLIAPLGNTWAYTATVEHFLGKLLPQLADRLR